jgi:hypothetical protein
VGLQHFAADLGSLFGAISAFTEFKAPPVKAAA